MDVLRKTAMLVAAPLPLSYLPERLHEPQWRVFAPSVGSQ